MNGIDYIADTNALIYFLDGDSCMLPYATKKFGFSIISEMELLLFSGITQEEEIGVKTLLSDCKRFQLTEEVKDKTIEIRRKYKTKLPDAIVAATAIANDLPLISADKGFRQITELNLILIEPIL